MKNIQLSILLLYTVVITTSCQIKKEPINITQSTPNTDTTSVYTRCQQPRTQMCTREFRPVCASRDNGIRCVTTPCPSTDKITKPNACVACSDDKVLGFTTGACDK